MENTEAGWYIVKQASNQCQILSAQSLRDLKAQSAEQAEAGQAELEQWGPFESKEVAIARRVGLIRAGKCEPA